MDNFWSESTTERERKEFDESMRNIALNLLGDRTDIDKQRSLGFSGNFRDFIRGLYGIQQGEISMGDDFPSYFSNWDANRRGSFWDERLMNPQDLLGMLNNYGLSEDFLNSLFKTEGFLTKVIEGTRRRALRSKGEETPLWMRHRDNNNNPTWTHVYGVSPMWITE
jgi:hypothetical protein